MKGYVLKVERMVPVVPAAIFEVLSDASKHPLIDGSGMLQVVQPGAPERLTLGSHFAMGMKMVVGYTTQSTVVEFEPDKLIAWQTGPQGTWGRYIAGRIWRYELRAVAGGTIVTESWDITTDHQRALLKLGNIWSHKTKRDMERTLDRLRQLMISEQPTTT
jgi:uncharacterized protein YndB with AHSA1/START domain